MKLYELAYACRLYASFTDFDISLKEFYRITNPALDLSNQVHGKALLVWLNSWGCRQFAKDYHSVAIKELADWSRHHRNQLPREGLGLVEVSDVALDAAAEAYGDLKGRKASMRHRNSQEHAVTFGPTGAAKVFYALRPNIFPPWDDPIREHFGYDGSSGSYRKFLAMVKEQISCLVEEAASFGIKTVDIPMSIGRSEASLPKLVDEYFWVTITSQCAPPSGEEIMQWARWAGCR